MHVHSVTMLLEQSVLPVQWDTYLPGPSPETYTTEHECRYALVFLCSVTSLHCGGQGLAGARLALHVQHVMGWTLHAMGWYGVEM